jgi:hypothetical protein
MDPIQRNGYDSTVLTFDDTIPPPLRNSLLIGIIGESSSSSSSLSNQDDDTTNDEFYQVYGPVFERNLRFDAKLRPELVSSSNNHNTSSSSISRSSSTISNTSTNSSSKNNKNNIKSKNNSNHNNKIHIPPSLGDATTPLPQVHAFYEYWINFTSWRDFSLLATQELQLSDTLQQSESRYEKRYYQNQIDKRTKQLKRAEMIRIQTLVERAMEADPRLYVIVCCRRVFDIV